MDGIILLSTGTLGLLMGMLIGAWLESPKRDARGRFKK